MKDLIKYSYVSLGTDSDSDQVYPTIQITYHDKPRSSLRASIYGLVSSPPENSLAKTFSAYGQESTLFSFCDDYANRLKGLEVGEVLTGNYGTGSYTYYDNDGNAKVFSSSATASLVGNTIYLGTATFDLLTKLVEALDIILQATYPSAVGPAGPMASPFSTQLTKIKTGIEEIIGPYSEDEFS